MLTDHEHGYTLSGMMFEPKGEKVSVSVKTTNRYPELQSASSLKFLYEQNAQTRMKLHYNNQPDTINELLPVVFEK